MLSLHTNAASLSAQNSLSRTQTALSTSMTRLSTGYRINSSADDAAGLQIATRLKSQTSGMTVAMRNTQNSVSMLQTADGALDEVTNILTRMKDLATQASDGSSSADDKTAMDSEYNSLTDELSNIFNNTSFGGTKLLGTGTGANEGKLNISTGIKFQIGAGSSETMTGSFATALSGTGGVTASITAAASLFQSDGTVGDASTATVLTTDANTAISNLSTAINAVSTLRSNIGAVSNRLDHVYNNLSNISTNTKNATGRIMDVDFATESANMTSSQMLMQAGTAMLKQSNSQSSMVMSLLQ
jgi:flagellin